MSIETAPPKIPSFYEMDAYVSVINRTVPRNARNEYLHFSDQSRPHFSEILTYFDRTTYERMGVLHGDYVLVNGAVLIARDGTVIKANMAWEDEWGNNRICDEFCASESFVAFQKDVLTIWDNLLLVNEPIVLTHCYSQNYFHWSLETVTRNRLFVGYDDHPLLVQSGDLNHVFQRELLLRTSAGKMPFVQERPAIKVRDPMLSHEIMSENSLRWLRKTMNIPVHNQGSKRIYLRRTPRYRAGGSICETLEFLMFLKEYGFESIDFSDQELTIEEQVQILENAEVILAPHGATLTNLTYLNPPLSVIEIISPRTPRALYMHIASTLGFHYYGVYSNHLDEEEKIMVDIEELRNIMRAITSQCS